jgi:hypothetical protein
MAILPATGSAVKMGGVYTAYTNVSPTNVKLSDTLGANYGGKVPGTAISFSSTFGGKTTPYGYV